MTERWAEPLAVDEDAVIDPADDTPIDDEPDEEMLAFLDAPVRPIEARRQLTVEEAAALAAREWIEDLRRYSKGQPRGKDGKFIGKGGGSGGAAQGSGGGKSAKPGDPIKLKDGTTIRPVAKSALSNPDTPRTRGVSREEFTALANEGHARLTEFRRNGGPPDGLDRNMDAVKAHAHEQVQSEWGGATYDVHTGEPIGGDRGYALTVKPPGVDSVSVRIGASREELDAGIDAARERFDGQLQGQHAHLGVFRDEDVKRIDIDPVLVVDNHHDVETIGSATHAVGGAYNMADGLGYWPPYVNGA
jgi:nitrite reductase/ring-hydroxylating ferredoxin subunit